MKIDLHIHSANSDGEDTIEHLIPKIKAAGVDVFALTDHDRTDGWAKASELANELGLSFIPGIEITTEGRVPDSDGNIEPFGIHLLAYLPDPNNRELAELLKVDPSAPNKWASNYGPGKVWRGSRLLGQSAEPTRNGQAPWLWVPADT